MDLSFGEQVRILLNRENMTIKDLAEKIEYLTGIKTSRQNLTQKLKRDNFQEQDMRVIAAVLGYQVHLSLEPASADITSEILKNAAAAEKPAGASGKTPSQVVPKSPEILPSKPHVPVVPQMPAEPEIPLSELDPDSINPFTGQEYLSNTVRKHPVITGYIQVYDRTDHKWADLSEEFFLRFQEQKKEMLGKEYSAPIYI